MKAKHPQKKKREWEFCRSSANHLFYREKRAPNDKKRELDSAEWDFSKVPESELVACFFHEYQREAESLNLRHAPDCPNTHSESVPEFFTIRRDLNAPWQKLAPLTRAKLGKVWVKYYGHLSNISIFDRLHIQTLEQSEQANVKTIEQFRHAHRDLYKARSPITEEMLPARLSQTEYGFFGINWNVPDHAIRATFAKWLVDRRADQKKRGLKIECKSAPRGAGNIRDQLRWLGALRIVNYYPMKYLVDYGQQDAKLKVPAPYGYSTDLYKAAKKARELLNWMAAGS
jgi:hypothetical protein